MDCCTIKPARIPAITPFPDGVQRESPCKKGTIVTRDTVVLDGGVQARIFAWMEGYRNHHSLVKKPITKV